MISSEAADGFRFALPILRKLLAIRCSLNPALHRNRGGFAAADAKGRDAALEVLRLQRVQQGHDQPSTGRADRMAERAGTTIDVELFPGNTEVALRRHRNDRECFVDLEQV